MTFSLFIDWAAEIYKEWSGPITVFAIVFSTLIVGWLVGAILRRLAQRPDPVRHAWAHGMLVSASAPAKALVWVLGIAAAAEVLVRQSTDSALSHILGPGRNVAIIVVAMWFLLRVVGRVQANLVARAGRQGRELDPTATDAISKLAKASIVITAILTMMQTLGFSIAGVLAFGGVGGIAIGFAAQSLVANLLGGLTIFASRPFKVGEYIIIPGTELMGGV
ncbi:MAG: mechanosensitive ion channel family protein, partial [Alcaligenaceae bacterium]|nr:mechanosensitive ion channel family protein [Alcaligenaceae bacterium]